MATKQLPALPAASTFAVDDLFLMRDLDGVEDQKVTLAQLRQAISALTAIGQITQGSTGGAPVALTPGDAGKVLTSNGPGNPLTYESPAGGGFVYPAPNSAEVLTGNTYDGKPEYLRVYTGTTGSSDSGNVTHSIGGIGATEIIAVFNVWINSTFLKAFPGANDDNTKSIQVVGTDPSQVNINFRSNDNRYNTRPYQFMITYVK